MVIEKVINNNIVSAYDEDGREVVIMGRGIGFGVKPGARIRESKIEKIFRIESRSVAEQLKELRAKAPHTFFLVPGYGAQGGGAADVARAFDRNGLGAIINSSRGIMCAYQKTGCDEHEYAQAARREALRMKDDIMAEIKEIRLP